MKLTIINIFNLLFVMFFTSCEVDDSDAVDRAIDDYFENAYDGDWGLGNFGTTIPLIDDNQIEFGLLFTTAVNGYFNEIIIRLPQKNNAIRATIWDISNDSIIRTEYFDVIKEGEFQTFNIDTVKIKANNRYGVTINSNDYYRRPWFSLTTTDYSNIPNDNFTSIQSAYIYGGDQSIPNISNTYGDLSFNFYEN